MIDQLKPYPVYQASELPWLRRVPSHWRVQRAKNLFRCIDVRSSTGDEELLTVSAEHGVIPRRLATVTMFKAESYVGYKLCWPGDLVINSLWAWGRGLGVSKHHGIVSSAYGVYRLRPELEAYSGFIHELVRSVPFNWELQVRSKGIWISRLQLTDEAFLEAPIPLPPADEQAAIVRFLDHADRQIRRYIRAKKKLITLLNEQKQAIVHHTVTRGLDIKAPTRPSRIEWLGNVPQDWRRVRLKQVATIQTGITLGKVYGDTPLIERPYLRVANVQSGRVELSKITTVRLPPAEAAGATLVAGDVLMTEGGDIDKLGRGCVWRGEIPECLHQNHVFAVRTESRKLLPEFLVAVMGSRHGRAYFQTTAKQTTNLAATNSTTLGNLPLWLPTTDVQQQILDWLAIDTAEIDGAADRALREVGLLHEYRSRLVADVVTGKIDVREASVHLPDASTPSEDEGLLAEATAESDGADLDDAEAGVIG